MGLQIFKNFKSIISILDIGAYCSCVLMVPGACAVSNSCNMSKNTKLLATECREGRNYQVKLAQFSSPTHLHIFLSFSFCAAWEEIPLRQGKVCQELLA